MQIIVDASYHECHYPIGVRAWCDRLDPNPLKRWGALLAFVIAMLSSAAMPANAASYLKTISVSQTGPDRAQIVLAYISGTPTYQLTGAGAFAVVILLRGSIVTSMLPRVFGATGPISSMKYEQLGEEGRLSIQLSRTVPIHAQADRDRIVIDVGGDGADRSAPTRSLGASVAAAGASTADTVEVITLKYADISEIVGVLVPGQGISSNDVFAPLPSALGQTSPNFAGGVPGGQIGAQSPQTLFMPTSPISSQALGQQINENIAVDRRLNAIILSGPAAIVTALRAKIDRLDIPLRNVRLETQIVELSENAAKSIGIDYANGGPLGVAALQSHSFQQPTLTLNLQAAIYDVVSRGGGRLLARPNIVAQDGGFASILTGDAIPIVTNVTSFGSSTVTQQQVQYIQVGVNLQIQPRASSDGNVTSHIYAQVSSVTGYVQGFPQISQRVATTTATVRSGESFVIGGLIRESELHSLAKIPGISALPIIGGLFRNRQESRTSTNLYIVVTPNLI